jgi:archaeosine synthase alpha-subunit
MSGVDREREFIPESEGREIIEGPPFYREEFETSFRYIIDEYEIAPRKVAIFLPCAVRKPYSTSPSHRILRKIIADVFDGNEYHIVIFGTCGIVPAELETMYPYAHYRYMLGRCRDEQVLSDFLRIETERISGYLEKTRDQYQFRLAYCIGLFREAMVHASERTGIPIDILLPRKDTISRVVGEEEDCVFREGSLMMEEYLSEFHEGLVMIQHQLE